MALRSPIVSVLGHVDHGKSSVLDSIRGSKITSTEAGGITQAIGASIVPLDVIKKRCGQLLAKTPLSIPGLLFIDTPGHAAFTNLRKRGGNLADIAVVVVDINEGFKPQTIEAVEILRTYKTPFVIAANKLDLVPNYKEREGQLLTDIAAQDPQVNQTIETRMYELVGQLHDRFQMNADRFDRIEDFTKQIAIVPTSAHTGKGISELLMVLAGLAQRFLEKNLKLDVQGPGKGTILEVKETTGFGTTLDVILYDGVIKRNETIVIGGIDAAIITKVRAILEPAPLAEMRDKKSKYVNIAEASAATGVRIAAPDLTGVVAGMPLRVAATAADAQRIAAELQAEVSSVLIATDKKGVLIKADALGSLEALAVLLREKGVPIRKASVGAISKKDIADAESAEGAHAVILGFNIPEVASTENVKIIASPIIYELVDRYQRWQEEIAQREQAAQLDDIIRPCKIEILQGCIFRQSNPCVAGIEVLAGTIAVGTVLMNRNGDRLTSVKTLQHNKESVPSARFGEQLAASLPDVTAGRQVHEHDVLYSALSEEEFRRLKSLSKYLAEDEKSALREIAELMRAKNPLWGV